MDLIHAPIAFIDGLGGPEMMLVFVIVLMLFGGQKLPEFARGLGKTMREFKKAASGVEEEFKRALDEDERKKNQEAAQAALPAPNPVAALPAPAATVAQDAASTTSAPVATAPAAGTSPAPAADPHDPHHDTYYDQDGYGETGPEAPAPAAKPPASTAAPAAPATPPPASGTTAGPDTPKPAPGTATP